MTRFHENKKKYEKLQIIVCELLIASPENNERKKKISQARGPIVSTKNRSGRLDFFSRNWENKTTIRLVKLSLLLFSLFFMFFICFIFIFSLHIYLFLRVNSTTCHNISRLIIFARAHASSKRRFEASFNR